MKIEKHSTQLLALVNDNFLRTGLVRQVFVRLSLIILKVLFFWLFFYTNTQNLQKMQSLLETQKLIQNAQLSYNSQLVEVQLIFSQPYLYRSVHDYRPQISSTIQETQAFVSSFQNHFYKVTILLELSRIRKKLSSNRIFFFFFLAQIQEYDLDGVRQLERIFRGDSTGKEEGLSEVISNMNRLYF